MQPGQMTLLPRLSPLALPRCADATAFVTILTVHKDSNETSTEITRQKALIPRMNMMLLLLQVMLESLRIAEVACKRDVLLLIDEYVQSILSSCQRSDCRAFPHRKTWARLFEAAAKRFEIKQIVVAHVISGIPAADKLRAMNFTQYQALVMIDADMLILRDMSDLFAVPQQGLTIARHPYDLAQGSKCGIPLPQRGVGALLALRPNEALHDGAIAYARSMSRFDLQHFSEQLPLTCYFFQRQQLHTLPCNYLYDVAVPRYILGRSGFRDCIRHGRVGRVICGAIASHIEEECLWPVAHRHVRAVHFKGKLKPWAVEGKCTMRARAGRRLLLVAPQEGGLSVPAPEVFHALGNRSSTMVMLTGPDMIEWSVVANACLSTRRKMYVLWPEGDPLSKHCCTVNVLLEVEWHSLRADYCLREARGPDGKDELRCWPNEYEFWNLWGTDPKIRRGP